MDAFDATFGVIAVTPEEGIYAVRVLKEWAEKIVAVPGTDGPFPEGSVEPFGPPR